MAPRKESISMAPRTRQCNRWNGVMEEDNIEAPVKHSSSQVENNSFQPQSQNINHEMPTPAGQNISIQAHTITVRWMPDGTSQTLNTQFGIAHPPGQQEKLQGRQVPSRYMGGTSQTAKLGLRKRTSVQYVQNAQKHIKKDLSKSAHQQKDCKFGGCARCLSIG